ncbi:EcsC family protein [Nocardioides sp. TF02-7]|uniref:EcsC family protein n=1 Tax=Nocardioides sp. TF02-7 TaxID=2917724 RepID=UPI001F070D77|nr:EcsC family protein [Nocardioides sp. TF02-7]UMG94354.1 EcsC family protein [Nocardioides sp. TF02-7]
MRSNVKRGLAVEAVRRAVPRLTELAPGMTSSFVREALNRAIAGVGPLPPAARAAEAQLREQDGDVDRGVRELIENHVRYAGLGGFVTNLGGLVTAAVVAPANITGLALIQCRMVAGIAHLRGYDLDDPRVRNAILVTVLGEESVRRMVKKLELPAPPMALATAPQHDPGLDRTITNAVASDLVSRVVGRRLATTVGRRVPLVGGVVGAGSDGYSTWKVGRYADREFLPRSAARETA